MKPTDPSSFVLQLIPSPGGNIIPDGILGPISTLGDLFSGALDVFFDFLLAPIKIVLFIFFAILLEVSSILYQVLLIVVTRAPVPEDSNGAVIFDSPGKNNSFYGMQQVMEGAIEPLAVVLVLIGIAIILFFRVFDVVMEFSFDSEGAQKRLLMAPLLIFLWIPIANLILVLASGLTDFFLNGINPDYGTVVDGSREYVSESTNSNGETEYNVTIRSILQTAAGIGDQGLGQGALQNFFGGSGSSGSLEQIIDLSMAIIFMIAGMPAILFGLILGLLRFFLLYMAYVLGPIAIALWAFKWKNIGSVGEKVIRGFILLALFPIPAALVDLLLPILTVSMEQATTSAATDLGGGTAGEETIQSVVRYSIGMTAPILVAFTPWILVVGFNKAAAGAGLAAGMGGVAAGQAGGAIAGGLKSSGKKGLSGAKGGLSGAKGSAKNALGTYKDEYKKQDGKFTESLVSGTGRIGRSQVGKARSATAKAKQKAKETNKSDVKEKASSKARQIGAGAGQIASEKVNKEDIQEKKSEYMGMANQAVNRHGGAAGTVMSSAMSGAGKGKSQEKEAADAYRRGRDRKSIEDDLDQVSDEAQLSDLEQRVNNAAVADNMRSDDIEELIARTDSLSKDRLMDDGSLKDGAYEIVGDHISERMNNLTPEELEDQYGEYLSSSMEKANKSLDHRNFKNAAQSIGGKAQREFLVDMEKLDEYAGTTSSGAVNTAAGYQHMVENLNYDEEDARKAREKTKDELSDIDGYEANGETVTSDEVVDAVFGGSYQGDNEALGKAVSEKLEIDEDKVMKEGEDEYKSSDEIINAVKEQKLSDIGGMQDAQDQEALRDIPANRTTERYAGESQEELGFEERGEFESPRIDRLEKEAEEIASKEGTQKAAEFVDEEIAKLAKGQVAATAEKLKERGVDFDRKKVEKDMKKEMKDSADFDALGDRAAKTLMTRYKRVDEATSKEIVNTYQEKVEELAGTEEVTSDELQDLNYEDIQEMGDIEHLGKMAEDVERGIAEFVVDAQNEVAKEFLDDLEIDGFDTDRLFDELDDSELDADFIEGKLVEADINDESGLDNDGDKTDIGEKIVESDALDV